LNRLQDFFVFRQAKLSDQSEIMKFINDFWRPNHILGTDADFFEYEHVNGSDINFFLAINKKTNSLSAIQGFISYEQVPNSHICGVMTKVSPLEKVPFLGVEIMRQMLKSTNPKTYCGIGTNPKTMVPLVIKFFKRHVGIMSQYFFLNPSLSDFHIVKISKMHNNLLKEVQSKKGIDKNYIRIADEKMISKNYDKLFFEKNLPRKSLEYVLKRYVYHPRYSYQNYLVYDPQSGNKSLLVAREVEHSGSTALRIIDFIGDLNVLGKLNDWMKFITSKNCYEYVDLLCNGINQQLIENSGFKLNLKDDNLIIPSYFEPFVYKNIDIYFEKSHKDLIIFKGDSDGDRPNIANGIVKAIN
jgi:hypothetical protein